MPYDKLVKIRRFFMVCVVVNLFYLPKNSFISHIIAAGQARNNRQTERPTEANIVGWIL
jgi:hypothetical protein